MKHRYKERFKNEGVDQVCQSLLANGYQAYLAGGCVRDYLLKREPKDFDVATNATPDQVMGLFERVIEVGKSFGVVRVVFQGEGHGHHELEVATFREEDGYTDGRRPDRIFYSTVQKDALRRDFTVNGLFYDYASEQIVDLVHGREDIQARILRAIGDPEKRFSEDYLRMLRAVRFSGELGFQIEKDTMAAIQKFGAKVNQVSVERIRQEVLRLLMGDHLELGIRALIQTDLACALFWDHHGFAGEEAIQNWPQIKEKFLVDNELSSFMSCVQACERDEFIYCHFEERPLLRFFLFCRWFFFHREEVGQSASQSFANVPVDLKHWKFSRKEMSALERALTISQKDFLQAEAQTVGELLEISFLPGGSWGLWWLEFKLGPDLFSPIAQVRELKKKWKGMRPDPLVAAEDLLKTSKGAGLVGKKIGVTLRLCYLKQLENPDSSKAEILGWWQQLA